MQLNLTPDQEVFRETTARFLTEHAAPDEIRRLRHDPAGFDPGYWRLGAELGWTSLLVSEAHGGGSISGDGLADLTLVADEFGRHAAPGPLVPANVVAGALSRQAGGAHAEVVADLLAGTSVASWAHLEPRPHDGLDSPALGIRVDGADVVLSGCKRPVESAAQAVHLLVSGRTGDGLTQVIVPADAEGLTLRPMHTIDLTRRFSEVTFDNVRVPADAVVGEVGGAGSDVELQLLQALVVTNAETVGAMQHAFDLTVQWAFDRYSFGRPLASYQELKHRFADMKTWLEAGHAVSDRAARAVSAEAPEAGELASAAKAFLGQYGTDLLQDCVQLHGGIGLTFEHDLHFFLRRVVLDRTLYGTPGQHRQRIATLASGRVDAGMSSDPEDVEQFRVRARAWIGDNLEPVAEGSTAGVLRHNGTDEEELAQVAHERELQRRLFDAGFAGLCFPVAYGGQGLTPAHQQAFNEELTGHEFPARLQAPTFSPCAAVLLDFGTEEQKLRHLPAILKGEELWMQFLSEPGGGSDVAGAQTSAVRDGDEWVLNGSKVWTTGAWWSDWGLCLARTNWDVPKHRGLSVFMLPIHQTGIEVHRIEMLNGTKEFCQEFLTDVRVPDSDRIGGVDDGWTVGIRWMFHERMLHNSPYVTVPAGDAHAGVGATSVLRVAGDSGQLDDRWARDLVGEARMLQLTSEALRERLADGMRSGAMSDQSAAIGRLFGGVVSTRMNSIAFELAGSGGGAWTDDDGALTGCGSDFLMRQVATIGGGTTEMARNVISERVLGMPRERALDRDVPFRDVPRGGQS